MLMCIKIALFPINQDLQQKPMIHWLLHSTGDSHVMFVTISSRTFSPWSLSRPEADHWFTEPEDCDAHITRVQADAQEARRSVSSMKRFIRGKDEHRPGTPKRLANLSPLISAPTDDGLRSAPGNTARHNSPWTTTTSAILLQTHKQT